MRRLLNPETSGAQRQDLKFRLAIERSSDAIFMTDADGTISYVNPAFEALYGFSSAEALGRTPRILKSGAQPAEFYADLWTQLLRRRVVPMEVTNMTKDGRLVHVDASANPILDERGELIGFLAIQRDITERRAVDQKLRDSEDRLRDSEAQYRGLFDSSPTPTWVFDGESFRFLAVNDATVRSYGYSRDEFLGMTIGEICAAEDVSRLHELARASRPGVTNYGAWKHKTRAGSVLDAEITWQTLELDGRRCIIVYAEDVTEKRRLADQFRQAQKMEAVGRLAGGVAHDFNNLLSVILSYASMATNTLTRGDPLREDMLEIERAGRRAAELTAQLLAFSRRQVLQPTIVDLNESLAKMAKMLHRLLGEDVELEFVAGDALEAVRVDPGQIEQVVMNLAVNARDAMPGGGRLTIETGNVDLDEGYARGHVGTKAGPHVMLAVSDSGVGMDAQTQSHIFEPFYTTKEAGRGTGLGLSTVFGIVEQSGGSIWVYSEPGKGTTFKAYFPCCERAVDKLTRPSSAPLRRGSETILLAEDEDQVRHLVRGILERSGYEVLAAATPAEALLLCQQHGERAHLLLTDVIMPKMNGPMLAQRVTSAHPHIKVLYMSGFAGNAVVGHGILDEGVAFLAKPVTPDALLRKIRDVLDERTRGVAP